MIRTKDLGPLHPTTHHHMILIIPEIITSQTSSPPFHYPLLHRPYSGQGTGSWARRSRGRVAIIGDIALENQFTCHHGHVPGRTIEVVGSSSPASSLARNTENHRPLPPTTRPGFLFSIRALLTKQRVYITQNK